MATGLLTKDTSLSYCSTQSGTYTKLVNLQTLPSISSGEPKTIDITTLDDGAHVYMKGLLDNGGSAFAFTFLYSPAGTSAADAQFTALNGLTGKQYWKVELPDGLTASFSGECSVALNEINVDEAITYTLSIVVDSEVIYA